MSKKPKLKKREHKHDIITIKPLSNHDIRLIVRASYEYKSGQTWITPTYHQDISKVNVSEQLIAISAGAMAEMHQDINGDEKIDPYIVSSEAAKLWRRYVSGPKIISC